MALRLDIQDAQNAQELSEIELNQTYSQNNDSNSSTSSESGNSVILEDIEINTNMKKLFQDHVEKYQQYSEDLDGLKNQVAQKKQDIQNEQEAILKFFNQLKDDAVDSIFINKSGAKVMILNQKIKKSSSKKKIIQNISQNYDKELSREEFLKIVFQTDIVRKLKVKIE